MTEAAKQAIGEDPIFRFIPENNLDDNATPGGMLRLVISDDGDALQIIDTTHIDIFGGELTPVTFGVDGQDLAEALGLTTGRVGDDGVVGRPINGRFSIDEATPLHDLNRGRGIPIVSPASPSAPAIDDLRVTLANGATFTVDLSGSETVGDVIDRMMASSASAIDPATSAPVTLDAEAWEVTFNEAYTGLALVDRTVGTGELSVVGENNSLAAVGLGIAGRGNESEDGESRRIEGVPLHGKTIADNVFIRQVAAASGGAALVTAGDTTLHLGQEIAAEGSTAVSSGTERIQLDRGTDLSGVFPGDRLKLMSTSGSIATFEIVSLHDRNDTVDVTTTVAADDFSWQIHRDVDLSRVVIGDQIRLAGRSDGMDGGDQFTILAVNNAIDALQIDAAPSDPTGTTSWTIDRLAPMLRGTGRLIGDDVDAAARLGFVEITIDGGTATGQLTAELSLGDTGSDAFDDRITLAEAYDGLRDVATKVAGRHEITFPETPADSYGGVLKLTIDEPTDDGTNATVYAVPFYVPPFPPPVEDHSNSTQADATTRETADSQTDNAAVDPHHIRARVIAAQLNLAMVAVEAAGKLRAEIGASGTFGFAELRNAIDALEDSRVTVSTAGDRLSFTLNDGIARPLTASAGQLSDLTQGIGLTDDDVRLIMKLLAIVPGSKVDRQANINDFVDSEDAVFRLGVTDDPARAVLEHRPKLNRAHGGSVRITIVDDDAQPTVLTYPYEVDETVKDVRELVRILDQAITSNRVTVSESSGRIVFGHTDAVRHAIVVEPSDEASGESLRLLGWDESYDANDPSAYVAKPKLIGTGELTLPVEVDLELGGFTPPVGVPEIHIGIPDLSLDDLSLPDALNVDLGELGDLASLRDFSLAHIVRAMQAGLGFLEGLEGFRELSFLNADLPMLDLNLREMLQIADAFGDIVVQLELNPVAGLNLVEEFLEDALGLPEDKEGEAGKPSFPVFTIPQLNEGLPEFAGIDLADELAYLSDPDADLALYPDLESYLGSLQGGDAGSVELSLDRQQSELAVRIDIGLDIARVVRQAELSVDVSSLGVPALSHLADTSAAAMIDVDAGAFIGLSLGIDLTHADGFKPFLYDMQGSGESITGTRVEILANASADDIDFRAAVGPLGVEIADGRLDLSGPMDVDPDTGRGKAKFTVGLGQLFAGGIFGVTVDPGDGRHYFDEIVARGETIGIASGYRAELTQGVTRIVLPPTTDLSLVHAGDIFLAGASELRIESIDVAGAAVTVAAAPTESIASAAWQIVRGTAITSGQDAEVTQDLTTVMMPAGTNLTAVEVGDSIRLAGQTGGERGGDTFKIVAIDHDMSSLRLESAPDSNSGFYAWSIARPGDFEFLLDLSDLQIDARGSATAEFPISFPGLLGAADGGLTATVGDFTDITSIDINADGAFGAALDLMRGNFNLSAIADGWNASLDLLTDAMRSQVFGLEIPLIGDALRDQADFLDRLRDSVGGNLQSNESNGQNDSASVRQALYDALGPGGLNWLKDLDAIDNTGAPQPDGAITIDDVVARADTTSGPGFIYDIHVGQDLVDLTIPAGFDLGIPGLDFALDAPVAAKLGFDMRLTMGLNIQDGFYIRTGPNGSVPEVQVYLDVSVPGLNASGELAYLRVDARDLPTAQATLGSGDARVTLVATSAGQKLAGVNVIVRDGATAGSETIEYDAETKQFIILIDEGITTAETVADLINSQPETSIVARDFARRSHWERAAGHRSLPNR